MSIEKDLFYEEKPTQIIPDSEVIRSIGETVIHVTRSDSPCYEFCPIVQRGIIEIMQEDDGSTAKSWVNFVNTIHDSCSIGPQTTKRHRFLKAGEAITEITCGSFLSKHHPDLRTARVEE